MFFYEWDAIYLLLMNEIIVFILIVLFEDLGSVNLKEVSLAIREVCVAKL